MSSFPSYEIWLTDAFGNLLDILDDVLYLKYNRSLNNIGSLELGLNGDYPNFNFFKVDGRIIVFRNGRIDTDTAWLIRRAIKALDENGTLTISIGCVSANELLLRRIVAYDDGTSYSDKTNMTADNMMKQVVRENFSGSATDTSRNVSSYFSVEADTGQGPTISRKLAWNTVMDVCQDISQATISSGSAVFFDVVSPTPATLEFRTYRSRRGVDHTFPGGTNPVVLSPDRGNMTSVLRSFDHTDEITYVYAGGQGFNQFKYVATASSSERIGQSPFGRREMFLNATQEGVGTAVDNAALSALRENRAKRVFQAQIVNVPGSTEYAVHWGFGDVVTVEFEGETLDCSIDAIQVAVENGEETIKAILRAEED